MNESSTSRDVHTPRACPGMNRAPRSRCSVPCRDRARGLAFDPLPCKVKSARTLTGTSQDYIVSVAHAAAPKNFERLATATLRCDGGASESRVKTEAKGVEFQNGPLGVNVYREIMLEGQPATGEKP